MILYCAGPQVEPYTDKWPPTVYLFLVVYIKGVDMNKNLMLILVILGLTSCDTKDEAYYRTHPKELQKAISACPRQKPGALTCQQIAELGNRMNKLGYQLQSNPPGFGGKILALQETIATQEIEVKKDAANSELAKNLEQNKKELIELLAVVKWLESPAS